MGLVLLILYLFASFVFPAEMFPSLAPYHLPYWIGIGGLAISAVLVFVRRGAPLRSVQLYVLFTFAAVLILSWLWADRTWAVIPQAINQFAPSVAMFVVTLCSVDSLRKLTVITGLVVFFSLVVFAQGFAAYHLGVNEKTFVLDPAKREQPAQEVDTDDQAIAVEPSQSDEPDVEDQGLAKRIRGLGMLHDPNDLALSFVAALPLINIPRRRWRTLGLLLQVLLSAALCYGVYLTHSRGGTLALLVVLFCVLARSLGRWRALVLVGILAIGLLAVDIGGGRLFLPQDESAAERLDAWSAGLQMLKSQPLIGVGYRQFEDHYYMTAHNSFVLCFAETGLVGYFFWLSLLGISLLELQKLKKLTESVPAEQGIKRQASILQTALIGFMVAAFFLSRTYVPLFYLLIGLTAALVLIAKKNDVPVVWPTYLGMGSIIAASELASIILFYFIGKWNAVA